MAFETQMQNQAAKGAKKTDASESPSYQGDSPKTKKEAEKPKVRKYLGLCSECLEGVYDDTYDIHEGHLMMHDNTMKNIVYKSQLDTLAAKKKAYEDQSEFIRKLEESGDTNTDS